MVEYGTHGSGISLGFGQCEYGSGGETSECLFKGLEFVPQGVDVAIMNSVVRYIWDRHS